jgi:hypothetical protein
MENNTTPEAGDTICPRCGGDTAIRNPTGQCDHLYYPDNVSVPTPEAEIIRQVKDFAEKATAWKGWLGSTSEVPDMLNGIAELCESKAARIKELEEQLDGSRTLFRQEYRRREDAEEKLQIAVRLLEEYIYIEGKNHKADCEVCKALEDGCLFVRAKQALSKITPL